MKLDHLGLTLDPQQLWMLPNMDALTPAYLVHTKHAHVYISWREIARGSFMRCRQRTVGRQHVVAVMSTASFAVVCVCVYDIR